MAKFIMGLLGIVSPTKLHHASKAWKAGYWVHWKFGRCKRAVKRFVKAKGLH